MGGYPFTLLKIHAYMVEDNTILCKMSNLGIFLENTTCGGTKPCVDLNSAYIYNFYKLNLASQPAASHSLSFIITFRLVYHIVVKVGVYHIVAYHDRNFIRK